MPSHAEQPGSLMPQSEMNPPAHFYEKKLKKI